ncbi:DNA polymerase III subunit gamma/tau [Flavobacterium sp. RHBU_3]|uniref:DNA polymerase III subunit gamma/tau n=1 Tax=Flavobacterium sp. RHBU_3 TaxID=3391184 RepID=UPI0039854780
MPVVAPVVAEAVAEKPVGITPLPPTQLDVAEPVVVKPPVVQKPLDDGSPRVNAFSLSSIVKKRELQENQKNIQRRAEELPKQSFSETDMKLLWNKFAQRLNDSGKKIMATYMQINDPVLAPDGFTIRLELPNEGSKAQFDGDKLELLGYLRGKLHNHDVVIETHVNEEVSSRHAFTPEEKYEKLKAINPALDALRKMFDLDV